MSPQPFIATKQHRRFIEFADAVRRQRTIGICFGQAGTGKPSQPGGMPTCIRPKRSSMNGVHAMTPIPRSTPR